MAICEMCGKEGDVVDSIVEGANMRVCLECSSYGHVVTINQPVVDKKIEREKELKTKPSVEMIDCVVDDYSEKIKKAREKRGLKQEDLAKDIAEKVSVIHQLESNKLKPSFKLAKKLEVFLNITLISQFEQNIIKKDESIDFKDNAVTIGDLLKDDEIK